MLNEAGHGERNGFTPARGLWHGHGCRPPLRYKNEKSVVPDECDNLRIAGSAFCESLHVCMQASAHVREGNRTIPAIIAKLAHMCRRACERVYAHVEPTARNVLPELTPTGFRESLFCSVRSSHVPLSPCCTAPCTTRYKCRAPALLPATTLPWRLAATQHMCPAAASTAVSLAM